MLAGGGGVRGALDMLAAHPDDWVFYHAVTERAQKLRNDRDRMLIEASAAATGNRVGEVIARAFARAFS
jgi:hypothetical protein